MRLSSSTSRGPKKRSGNVTGAHPVNNPKRSAAASLYVSSLETAIRESQGVRVSRASKNGGDDLGALDELAPGNSA